MAPVWRWSGSVLRLSTRRLFLARRCRRALFGSLQDLVDTELAYESSDEYRDDEAYWQQNLPTEPTGDYGLEDAGERDPWPSAPVAIDPASSAALKSWPESGTCRVPR